MIFYKNVIALKSLLVLGLLVSLASSKALAQDDLMDLVTSDDKEEVHYTTATFKGSRLINGQSVETRRKSTLEFLISHRFGRLNTGAYEFFGLDGANVRFGLEYAVSDNFTAGFGRNSFEKTYDFFMKYRLLRQSTGAKNMPFTLTLFSSAAIKTLRANDPDDKPSFNSRLVYTYQMMLARKLSEGVSIQLMPSLIHRNEVVEPEENDVFALGTGGRIKLSKRVSLNLEYYYQFNRPSDSENMNSLAVGFDIETGGHVFQLHLTNSRAMIEKGFITETDGDFFGGDLHFGFNISRSF